ncbi:hypothetical protein KC19_1G166900 [Ceratodon purpureus]|uniref:Uncharacterized protein n=1 Tax=Ceratodon purpureus TaxID=3225 RepID=A0A8T0J8W1_CERPU|nr:hypothetical protein KC19_1G166900 [Ceratodon purpureus]
MVLIKQVSRIWLLLRGTVTWMIWRARNDASFEGRIWPLEKSRCKIWLGLIEYGRIAWEKTQTGIKNAGENEEKQRKLLEQFKSLWCWRNVFACWADNQPTWNLASPRLVLRSEE